MCCASGPNAKTKPAVAKTDTENLLRESPYSMAYRPLTDEPLSGDDWQQVRDAHRAFIVQVRMIVIRARSRAEQ